MIVFIPIKENSQRVPNKNFRNFKGKPLWKHTIDKLSDFFVFIDTDSEEIIRECKNIKNVKAYRRFKGLMGDKTSVVDLIENFIRTYEIKSPLCQIHVTSPFLKTSDIKDSFHKIKEGYDSVFSVTKTQKRFWDLNDNPLNHNPKKLIQTQDLEPWYEENSYLYTFKPNVIYEYNNRISKNCYKMEIGFPYNLDIDNEDDWDLINKI